MHKARGWSNPVACGFGSPSEVELLGEFPLLASLRVSLAANMTQFMIPLQRSLANILLSRMRQTRATQGNVHTNIAS